MIEFEFFFQALWANTENGNRLRAGPQAGPILVVNHGRSMIPFCSIDFCTFDQSPPIFRLTHLEGLTDESNLKPAAAKGAAIQVSM